MANPKWAPSVGVFARQRFDWVLAKAQGGFATLNGVAGNYNFCALYNNSQSSSYIGLYAMSLWNSATNGTVALSQFQGQIGTFQNNGNPLVSAYPISAGQVFTGNQATQPGHITTEYGGNGQYYEEFSEYPFQLIPPSWSLVFVTSTTGAGMTVSFIWAPY
jgi:hypothetical protein